MNRIWINGVILEELNSAGKLLATGEDGVDTFTAAGEVIGFLIKESTTVGIVNSSKPQLHSLPQVHC